MRKPPLAAALLAFAVCLAAQEVPGTPASTASTDITLLNVGNYSKLFINGGGNLAPKYADKASDVDYI